MGAVAVAVSTMATAQADPIASSPLQGEMGRLFEAIGQLSGLAESIEDRLRPVLHPPDQPKCSQDRRSHSVPHVDQLIEATYRLDQVIDVLNDVHGRLGL